jgi:hypothetical protein
VECRLVCTFEILFFQKVVGHFQLCVLDVVNGLSFVVDDGVLDLPGGGQGHTDLVDDIFIEREVLGVRSYSRLKVPHSMFSVFMS